MWTLSPDIPALSRPGNFFGRCSPLVVTERAAFGIFSENALIISKILGLNKGSPPVNLTFEMGRVPRLSATAKYCGIVNQEGLLAKGFRVPGKQ